MHWELSCGLKLFLNILNLLFQEYLVNNSHHGLMLSFDQYVASVNNSCSLISKWEIRLINSFLWQWATHRIWKSERVINLWDNCWLIDFMETSSEGGATWVVYGCRVNRILENLGWGFIMMVGLGRNFFCETTTKVWGNRARVRLFLRVFRIKCHLERRGS